MKKAPKSGRVIWNLPSEYCLYHGYSTLTVCFSYGYWSQAGISHLDDQESHLSRCTWYQMWEVCCGYSSNWSLSKYCTYSLREILLNKKDFSEASLCRCQPSVPTTKVISQVSQFNACKYCDTHKFVHYIISFRASGNGPAAPVLAGPVFLKVKNRSPFLQKAGSQEEC